MNELLMPLMSHVIWVFAVSNPIPSNLKSEAKKAAKILRDFTEISSRNGPDKLIPGNNLSYCQLYVLRASPVLFKYLGFLIYFKM